VDEELGGKLIKSSQSGPCRFQASTAARTSAASSLPSATYTDKILDAAEYAASLFEAAEMVPMDEPPTALILYWRQQPPEKRNRATIRKFAYELGLEL
jgi:hypothetical protein